MHLRNWQQKIIDEFPSIIRQYRRFILKAPTGAGKTVLASEIIERFYKDKKVVVLCHRLVLLEQLEKALSKKHTVRKLAVSDTGPAFEGYDILLSTNMRARDVLADAVPKADLIIVDEAHHARRKEFLTNRYRPNRLMKPVGGAGPYTYIHLQMQIEDENTRAVEKHTNKDEAELVYHFAANSQ